MSKDIKEHENNSQLHLQLSIETVYGLQNKFEHSVPDLERRISDIDSRQCTIEKTSQKQEDMHECLQKLQSIICAQSKEILELKSVVKRQARSLNRTGGEEEESDEECQFTNFAKRKSRNGCIYSPPFYSSPGGYKMCIGICPNGTGEGKDSHVSVFIYLIRGENDDNLTWPFTGTVVIELLNQLEDKEHHQVKIRFKSEEASSQRVIKSERSGSGYGRRKFISHSDLDYKGAVGTSPRQYLKDDCLYFRYEVKCTAPKPWLSATNVF